MSFLVCSPHILVHNTHTTKTTSTVPPCCCARINLSPDILEAAVSCTRTERESVSAKYEQHGVGPIGNAAFQTRRFELGEVGMSHSFTSVRALLIECFCPGYICTTGRAVATHADTCRRQQNLGKNDPGKNQERITTGEDASRVSYIGTRLHNPAIAQPACTPFLEQQRPSSRCCPSSRVFIGALPSLAIVRIARRLLTTQKCPNPSQT